MKSIVIISAGQLDLARISGAYSRIGSTGLQSNKRLVVEGDWGWFALGLDDELRSEFSDTERDKIAQLLGNPVYFQLEYSNTSAADIAVQLMPVPAETLVDNDHGVLRRFDEVRHLIRAGLEWQTTSA